MPFLLDTHTFVWAVSDQHLLSARVLELLADDSNDIFVSPVSAYELVYKFEAGKWPEVAAIAKDFLGTLSKEEFTELPVTIAAMVRAASFASDHRDPWDRILAAQSLISGFSLLSIDPMIDQFCVDRIWA